MNTQTNNLLTALTSVLLAPPFVIKINEERINALQSVIASVLPATVSKLTDTTRALLPSLNGGAMFDTLTDDIVIHIPAFYRSTKAINGQGNEALLVAKQSVTFILDSYSVESVRFFSLAIKGLAIQPQWAEITKEHNDNCKLTELVDRIIPVLQGATQLVTLSTNTAKNYAVLATNMGLEFFTLHTHMGYGVEGYDQHREDNSAISIYIKVDKADVVESAMQAKKGGTFIYSTASGLKYDVVPSNIVESRKVVAVKYRFTLTKA